MIVVISVRQSTVAAISGLHCRGAGYGQFEHKADSLIAKFKEAGGTVREIDVWARVTAIITILVICIIVCLYVGCLLIITVITPLPTKPSATKMPENWSWRTAAITDACRSSAWCCCARCKIHEGVSWWLKLENDALRDDVAAGRRRLHIKAVCQSVREATTASGVDNAASPDWQTPLNGIIHPQREADHAVTKQLE